MSLPQLALYVHFPWCVRKCPYCDFNSHTLHGELPQDAYIDALLRDLDRQGEFVSGRVVESIFLGGGTPSLFSPDILARLFHAVRSQLTLAADVEITLEANPGTIERGRFADYQGVGVTRVSLGAQSFDDAQLQRLGRIHAANDTRRAVEELHAAGLTNFNLDLMYGLPQQSIVEAAADIDAAIALQPTHLSHYQLTLEPGTVFAGRPPSGLPDADEGADMQLACQERLAQAGFAQYEVSAYARDNQRCRHNLNYWEFGDYLGLGAGAHGKCTRLEPGAQSGALIIERTVRLREPRRYLAEVAGNDVQIQRRRVPTSDLPFEYLLNALRLNEGFEQSAFEARTGLGFETLAPSLEAALRQGLIRRQGERWSASSRGFSFLNDLQAIFLPNMSDSTDEGGQKSPTYSNRGMTDDRLYSQHGSTTSAN
jgi:putative oxygen-independent coproporphyrinogen III oxidase